MLGVLLQAPALAATIRVDNQTACSDAPGSAIYCTINAAVARAGAGDTVSVEAGNYDGPIHIDHSGSPGLPITIVGRKNAVVISLSRGFDLDGASWVTIRGFTILQTAAEGIRCLLCSNVTLANTLVKKSKGAGISIVNSSDMSLSENRVEYALRSGIAVSDSQRVSIMGGHVMRAAYGIEFSQSADSLIKGTEVSYNFDAGIYLGNASPGLRVKLVTVHHNGAGIEIRSAGNIVESSVIYENDDSGIKLHWGAANGLVINNAIYRNGGHGIEVKDSTAPRIANNSLHRNQVSGISVGQNSPDGYVLNNISADNGGSEGNINIGSTATADYNIVSAAGSGTLYVYNGRSFTSLAALRDAFPAVERRGSEVPPGWVNAEGGDFHLTDKSAAIDSGKSDAVPSGAIDFDLEGKGRCDDSGRTNSGSGPISYMDRGAFEFRRGCDAAEGGRPSDSDGVTSAGQVSSAVGGIHSATILAPVVWEGRISASANDAEQTIGGTSTSLNSTDLELVTDAAVQVVGMRFTNVAIPQGATISNAYVQFATDEVSTAATSLTIAGEAADNSAIFTTAANNISARATTTAPVIWSPPAWNTLDEAVAAQRTPDLSGAVQQVVGRSGWASGNALTIIVNGSGKRVARAFDVLSGSKAPLLHVEYSTAADTTPPSTPTGLSGTAISPTQINLSWTASSDNIAVTGYRVFRGGTEIATTTTPSFSNIGLNPNATYSYSVSAFDAAGNNSAQSSSISVTTPNSTGAIWEGRISASANDAEQIIGGKSTNLTSNDLELVTDGSVQTVGMRFTNVAIPKGAQISNAYVQFVTDEVSTGAAPLTIAGEAADNSAIFTTAANNISSRAKTQATISWSPPGWNTIDEAGLGQRTPNIAAAVQQIIDRNGWASGNALAIIVNGTGKRVARSYNISTGTKAPLLHVEYSMGGDTTPPSTPTSLSGTAVSQNQINLSWTASTDNVGVTGYKVFRGGTQIATTSSTSYSSTGLAAGASYVYAVSAYDAAGNNSGQSGSVTVATFPADTEPPSMPSGLTATPDSASQITLRWGASTDNVAVAGYKVFRTGNATAIATVTDLFYSDNGLTPNTSYSYKISAFDAVGNSSLEAGPVTATTLADDVPPSIPTGLTAAAVSSTEVSLKWNAATDNLGVSGYRVFRNGSQVAVPAGTQYFDSRLAAGVTYTYMVTAVDTTGNSSSESESVSVVTPSSGGPIVFVGAGDIAAVTNNAAKTATLLDQIVAANPAAIVYTLGDNAYPDGSASVYASYYQPTWGRHKLRTRPAPGNHDYLQPSAQPYYDYFGPAAGEAGKGYYSYDLGSWHIVSLNSEINMAVGSPQEVWLRADLAAHPSACILAYWHKTLFTSGTVDGPTTAVRPLWQALYEYGADLILSGHEHNYERFAPQTPNGAADSSHGIRQIVAGTAGGPGSLFVFGTPAANSQVRNNQDFGVLKLTLNSGSYSWDFVPVAGGTFTDTGSSNCSTTVPDITPPSTPAGLSGAATSPFQINLSWAGSSDNVGVTGYKVFRGGVEVATTASTSFSDTGLTANTAYAYRVSAFDAAGNDSAQSATATITTQLTDTSAPSIPTSLSGNAVSPSAVHLDWTASTDNVAVAGYKVFRDGGEVARVTALSYSDSGLSPVTSYQYIVSAYDTSGNDSGQSGSVTVTTPPAVTATEPYSWNRVAIGGGGYITGLVAHPGEAGLVYARTDNGGAYRFDAAAQRWIWISKQWTDDQKNYFGVDGIAVDPNNANVVFIAAGKDLGSPGAIFKSTDRGDTWVKLKSLNFAGNGSLRWAGELIQVDPNNSNIIFSGSRQNGLFRSIDGGANWAAMPGVPVGASNVGIRTVAIDASSLSGGKSQRVYAGVSGLGVYRTTDGGATWAAIAGSPANPRRMSVASDGTLYVSAATGVFKYKTSWSAISPAAQGFAALDVARNNPNRIITAIDFYDATGVGPMKMPVYLSNDGGTSWTSIVPKSNWTFAAPWYPNYRFSAATADIQFDPFDSKHVLMSDWYQVWTTNDIDAATVQWNQSVNGIEQMAVLSIVAPQSGAPLISGVADNHGFRHTSLDQFPGAFQNIDLDVSGIDFCESNPNMLFELGGKTAGAAAYSADNGATWTSTAWPYAASGKVAVSASDPNLVVAVPQNTAPKRSLDRGQTWLNTTGAPAGGVIEYWTVQDPIASDRALGNSFYYLAGNGDFYRSSDGGASWSKTVTLPVQSGYMVKAAPELAGEVWVSSGGSGGLRHSSDGGLTFTKLNDVDNAISLGFGKNPPGLSTPTVFLIGSVSGEQGVYRSDNMGVTWIRINDSGNPFGMHGKIIEGDRQVFGRVYIATDGESIFYGVRP